MTIRLPKLKLIILLILTTSCATKKKLLYFQDADIYDSSSIHYTGNTIQTNDILSVSISALLPESAIPYNKQTNLGASQNTELLKLNGYLVDTQGNITLPILGIVKVSNKSISEVEQNLVSLLESGGHLINPTVNIRVLNAKVTILGEVNNPGTYSFTEQYITVPQALGYAGDLNINGKRNDILLIREANGIRNITHIDLTNTQWFNDDRYLIKPNDIIVVNPNQAKVKSAGIISNVGTFLSVFSVLLSTTILLTR